MRQKEIYEILKSDRFADFPLYVNIRVKNSIHDIAMNIDCQGMQIDEKESYVTKAANVLMDAIWKRDYLELVDAFSDAGYELEDVFFQAIIDKFGQLFTFYFNGSTYTYEETDAFFKDFSMSEKYDDFVYDFDSQVIMESDCLKEYSTTPPYVVDKYYADNFSDGCKMIITELNKGVDLSSIARHVTDKYGDWGNNMMNFFYDSFKDYMSK